MSMLLKNKRLHGEYKKDIQAAIIQWEKTPMPSCVNEYLDKHVRVKYLAMAKRKRENVKQKGE
jgi:hypothetical protein